jgi:hypothetical protein
MFIGFDPLLHLPLHVETNDNKNQKIDVFEKRLGKR